MEKIDAASIEIPPPIRMETDKPPPITHDTEEEEQDLAAEMPTVAVNSRSFSIESTVVQAATGAKEHFKDYCKSSAIHGVRYFAEDGRSRIEKIFWFAAITLSMAGCFHLIWKVWQKWDTSPVIVSFAESATSIWEVPFPAVSICPETKSRQTVFNFTEFYYKYKKEHKAFYRGDARPDNNVTRPFDLEQLERFSGLSLLCRQMGVPGVGAKTLSENTRRFLEEIAPDLSEMMKGCKWKYNYVRCSNVFRPVWSDEGLCFTFNMLDNRELFTKEAIQYREQSNVNSSCGWDLEKGYSANSDLETSFPARAMGSGEKYGLNFVLRTIKSDLDYLCQGPIQGFKIVLHDPAEIPIAGHQPFLAPLNHYIVAAVRPSMMTTSKRLHDYAPHRRQCYFPRERQLRFFQVYTKKNCELECITNLTLKRCDCVQMHMPRDNKTAICGPGKFRCFTEAYEETVQRDIRNNLESLARGENPARQTTECDCLASCFSLGFDVETSQINFDQKSYFKAIEIPARRIEQLTDEWLLTSVSIFFKDPQFMSSRRSGLFGQTDFFANCGGLLGLFSGFSFISLIEILYFLTIRLWCRIDKRSRRRKSSAVSQPATKDDPEKTSPEDNVLPAQRF